MMNKDTGIRAGLQTMMVWDTVILNFYKKYIELDQERDIFF